MELTQIKGIGPAKQTKLNEAGIDSIEDLSRADVAAVAEKTGMTEAAVRELKERAVALVLLEDVKGLGPATIQTLAEAGIRSLKDLVDASAERLAAEAKVAREKAKEWQAEAKKAMERMAEDAKTPEGRKRLAEEGQAFAKKTAQAAQDTTMALIERLQRDGEAALKRYQELREKAPEKAQQYREKAESLLKEAETRALELREKAERAVHEVQVRVKTEAEKAKAANEGLLTRIKARFVREKNA